MRLPILMLFIGTTIPIAAQNLPTSPVRLGGAILLPAVKPPVLPKFPTETRRLRSPPIAVIQCHTGSPVMRVHVASNGMVSAVYLLKSSGFRVFDEVATGQAWYWHLNPKNGADQTIKINFDSLKSQCSLTK